MSDYWDGVMNWPLNADWQCPVCAARALVWGIVHGICRCEVCHLQFTMRERVPAAPEEEGPSVSPVISESTRMEIVDTPIPLCKPEDVMTLKMIWQDLQVPVDGIGKDLWEQYKGTEAE